MRYVLLIYADENAWTEAERDDCYDQSKKLVYQLKGKGQYLSASPLQPVATATSVRVRAGKCTIHDGPFAETKEQLGGYLMIEVKNLDEAIRVASMMPGAQKGTVEIRPVREIINLP